MSHNKKAGRSAPIPPANRPQIGPQDTEANAPANEPHIPGGGAPFAEQDPKRRLGDYVGKGEHSFVQPGGRSGNNKSN